MQESRTRIVEAIIAVIADSGIEKATVRTVAQQAGVSVGAVQHHLPTKAHMLEAAMQAISTAVATGVQDVVDSGASVCEVLRELARILAIVDDGDLAMAGVWLDFVALSRVTPDLAAIHQESWATLRQRLGDLISRARPDHPDSPAAAAALLVSLDGIAVARVTEPDFMTGARASAIVDAMLDVLAHAAQQSEA